ncbi:MAG: 50S ribosomal protein L16 [Promethearchaeota archaeon]
MAHRRPWRCYSSWSRRPFQYKRSSNRRREYARGGTQSKIQRYWGGSKLVPWEDFELVIGLKCDNQIQISSNALEAIRITVNSALQKYLGRSSYRFRVRPKPYQKYRENRMLAFAGADRVQSGMRNSFGRSTGVCARVRAGSIICEVGTSLRNLPLVRERLRVASMKVSCPCSIVILKFKSPEFFKKSGLPLYDAKKRKEVPLYEVALA